jgi:hypothetical protein
MLADMILIVVAIAIILAAGMTAFYCLVREPQRYYRFERLAYSYPLGLAILGITFFVISWAGFRLNAWLIGATVFGTAFIATKVRGVSLRDFWLSPCAKRAVNVPLTDFEWILVFIIILCLSARTLACLMTPLCDWDALCFWGLKSKICYFSTIRDAGMYFHSPEYRFTNQTYPLLWPMMYAWVCTVLGRWDDLRMLAINPLNLIVFTGLVYFTTRRYVQRTVALIIAALVASLPSSLHYVECGQSDIPLMLISGASLFALFDWIQQRRRESILLAAVLMGGALFVKHEGQILFGVQVLVAAASILRGAPAGERRRLWGDLAWYIAIAVGMALPWLVYRSTIPKDAWQLGGEGFSRVRWEMLPTFLHTIVQNAVHWYNGVGLPKWNLLWPIIVLFVVLSKSPRQSPWIYLLVVFLLHAGAITLIHLASHVPLTLAHEFALERYTLIMLPPLWLLLAKCADEWWTIWKAPQDAGVATA